MLIVAATDMEIEPFLLKKMDLDVLITGVGVPACMYTLTKKIATQKYDVIVQAGICGSFLPNVALGQTYFIVSDAFADLGINENNTFYSLFEKNFANPNKWPFTGGKLLNTYKNKLNLPEANAITINTVTDNPTQNELYKNKYNAAVESMEGAALHYVCLQENIPFIQLRNTSNYIGERNKNNWRIKEAIEGLNKSLLAVIEKID